MSNRTAEEKLYHCAECDAMKMRSDFRTQSTGKRSSICMPCEPKARRRQLGAKREQKILMEAAARKRRGWSV